MGRGRAAAAETAGKKSRFLEEYRHVGNTEMVSEKMTAAGDSLSRFTVYSWLDKDEDFAAKYRKLKENRNEQVQDNVYAIATGQKDAKKSEIIGAIFWLTHNMKEIYGGGKYGAGVGRPGVGQVQRVERQEIVKDYERKTVTASREVRTLTQGPDPERGDLAQQLITEEINASVGAGKD